MPPHYAITEAFIVLSALYCGWKLARRSQWMGAIGVLLFGAAASIGVYRFPSGQVEELASIHKWAGQIGGVAGMALIASEVLRHALPLTNRNIIIWACLFASIGTVLIAILRPALAVPFFLLWSLICIAAAFGLPRGTVLKRLGYALGASLMLFNVILFRQSPILSQDMSWHVFHTLIAVWIVAIFWILTQSLTTRKPLEKTAR